MQILGVERISSAIQEFVKNQGISLVFFKVGIFCVFLNFEGDHVGDVGNVNGQI
ncbi:hypothetical protein D3C86_2187640 [compost metagenome]